MNFKIKIKNKNIMQLLIKKNSFFLIIYIYIFKNFLLKICLYRFKYIFKKDVNKYNRL